MAGPEGPDPGPGRPNRDYQHVQIRDRARAQLGDSYHISEFPPESSDNGVMLTSTRQLCRCHDQYAVHFSGRVVTFSHSSDSPPLARADYVARFSHTSLQPVKAFVRRPTLHEKIRKQLHDGAGDGGATKMVVVWGLGGVGKTQLALTNFNGTETSIKRLSGLRQSGRNQLSETSCISTGCYSTCTF
jgi:hypothetical protein